MSGISVHPFLLPYGGETNFAALIRRSLLKREKLHRVQQIIKGWRGYERLALESPERTATERSATPSGVSDEVCKKRKVAQSATNN